MPFWGLGSAPAHFSVKNAESSLLKHSVTDFSFFYTIYVNTRAKQFRMVRFYLFKGKE